MQVAKMMKKAVIIGATSGIGRELAFILSENGYQLWVTGRREPLLNELRDQLPGPVSICFMDVRNAEATLKKFREILNEAESLDLVIISAGTGSIDPRFPWKKEKDTLDTNVIGFAAIANASYHHFVERGVGHLVGITSLAAIRGGLAVAYNASKTFESSYLQGLRNKIVKLGLPIAITEIRPGFVDTRMAKGEGLFWVQPPRKAALQIYHAIRKRKKMAYVTKRWRLIAWLIRILPDFLYNRL